MKTRIIYSCIAVGILVCVSLFLFLSQRGTPDTYSATIGYSGGSLNYGSVMVAEEGDFFGKNGISVKMAPLKSGSQTRLALSTGKIDMALMNISDILVAIDAGAPIKILFPTARATTVVFVRPDNAIQTFADLRGKTIHGATGASRLEFLRAAAHDGFKPSDFTFVDIDKEYREIALLQKKVIDAIPVSRYNEDSLRRAGAIPLREWEAGGYDSIFAPHTFLAVNTEFARGHEAEIQKVADALVDAQRFIKEHPEQAAVLVIKNISDSTDGVAPFTVPHVLESWEKSVKYVLWSDPNEVRDIVDFLHESKQIQNNLTLDQIFDFRFRDILAEKQRTLYGTEN